MMRKSFNQKFVSARLLLPLSFVLSFLSCDGQVNKKTKRDTAGRANQREQMILMNQRKLSSESAKIDAYIAKNELSLQRSGTGLRYSIQKGKGKPDTVHAHEKILLAYIIENLAGTRFYAYPSEAPDTVILGENSIPKGMEEALLKMHPGDKATLILPAHLAYGMIGDEKKIPPGSILFCKMELIRILKEEKK